jgi:cytochrome c peroxidase
MMGRNLALPFATIAAAVLIVAGCDGRSQASLEAAAADPLAALTGNTVLTDDELVAVLQLFAVIPEEVPDLPGNPITPEKVELGKMLFFEPRLSSSWLISCNTCHNMGLAGVDLLETSVGHGWQRGPRNAPTVLNAVFNAAQFWDGRAEDLMEQAKGPVQAAVEMASTPDRVVRTLRSIPEYVALFEAAFPGEADPVTFDNMARAIEAFEATLITPDSRFDRFLLGDATALDRREQEGLQLFVQKGCVACHSGVNVGGQSYHPFGVVSAPDGDIRPADDKGRYTVTRTAGDEYVFRAPSLRNVQLTAPYFHSGKVWDLAEAVRVMGSSQLGAELTEDQVDRIVAYLATLTGRQPQVEYPILPPHTPDTPRPDITVGAP